MKNSYLEQFIFQSEEIQFQNIKHEVGFSKSELKSKLDRQSLFMSVP